MDKKYYVGDKPKYKKLRYFFIVLFIVFSLIFLASIFASATVPYDLTLLTLVSIIPVVAGAFIPAILSLLEPQPLCAWSVDKCFSWLHAHRPENLFPTVLYSSLGNYFIFYAEYYMGVDSKRLQLAAGDRIGNVARDAVYKVNESELKEKSK